MSTTNIVDFPLVMRNYLDGEHKTFQELMTGIAPKITHDTKTTPYCDTPSLISQVHDAQNKFIQKTNASPNVMFLGRQEKRRFQEIATNNVLVKNKSYKRSNAICGLKIRFTRRNSEVTPALILGAL